MYLRPVHTEYDIPTLYAFIRSNPLGILTTAIQSSSHPLIQSSHIPWVLDPSSSSSEKEEEDPSPDAPLGKLRGHLARANPQTKALIESATRNQEQRNGSAGSEKEASGIPGDSGQNGTVLEEEVMILFNGPVHHYVTPKFYTETKPSTGKVVPTWDYSAVQVYGIATLHYDTSSPSTDAFLSKQLDDLSLQSEEREMGYTGRENGREDPWSVGEAPERYVGLLKKAIVGVEIEIKRCVGKWKMSQELGEGDRSGVVRGFEGLGTEEGREMARVVRERGLLKEEGRSG